jgi:hypothetical protein
MDQGVKSTPHRFLTENVPDSFHIGYRDGAQDKIFCLRLNGAIGGGFVNGPGRNLLNSPVI